MADESEPINQDQIEQLLAEHASEQPSQERGPGPPARAETPPDGPASQSDIEAGLNGGGQGATSGSAPTSQTSQISDPPQAGAANTELPREDIEQVLGRGGAGSSPATQSPAVKQKAPQGPNAGEGGMGQADVEFLLTQAQKALESIDSESPPSPPPGLATFELEQFGGEPASTESATLDLVSDVHLDVKIELGRTHMYLEDVLRLRKGSVVPLDKLAGDPVDIYVNERLIARGEVLVLNDNFCVRVGELIAGSDLEG